VGPIDVLVLDIVAGFREHGSFATLIVFGSSTETGGRAQDAALGGERFRDNGLIATLEFEELEGRGRRGRDGERG
jgi:hypothetical protein